MSFNFHNSRRFRQALPLSGPTADRPVDPPVWTMYYDTDVHKPIWYSGADWRSATNVIT